MMIYDLHRGFFSRQNRFSEVTMSLLDVRIMLGRCVMCSAMVFCCGLAGAQQMTLTRGGATVVLEGYAANVVRVSISMDKRFAMKGPGVGITAAASQSGWKVSQEKDGDMF